MLLTAEFNNIILTSYIYYMINFLNYLVTDVVNLKKTSYYIIFYVNILSDY